MLICLGRRIFSGEQRIWGEVRLSEPLALTVWQSHRATGTGSRDPGQEGLLHLRHIEVDTFVGEEGGLGDMIPSQSLGQPAGDSTQE